MSEGNFPVVLTADRTLMAAYPLLLDGMVAAAQTAAWTTRMMWPVIAPRVARVGLRAHQAPLGLRRIEAALLSGGFSPADVAVVPAESVAGAIGPRTRIVGLSSGDPLGVGMNSTTVAGVFGGRPITSALFERLLRKVRRRVAACGAAARVILGGPGVWQLREDDAARRQLGIDHLISGYCEDNVADVVRRLLDGDDLPPVIEGQGPSAEAIPSVAAATVMGMVELSRGCGWGCRFCTLAAEPMQHLPPETILADVRTNLAAGVRNISLTSEDAFRYGAARSERANPDALIDLLRRVGELPGLATLAVDHANVATLAQFTDEQLAEVGRLLALGRPGHPVWINLGVETASGPLLSACGAGAKMRPFAPEQWGDVCLGEVERLCRSGFLPIASVVVGLPGETAEHVEETLDWLDRLAGRRAVVVPVFHTPVRGEQRGRIAAADLTRRQWHLFRRSMNTTFKWMPRLYWQHQAAAGVSWPGRILRQVLGRGYAMLWRGVLRRKERAAGSS